MTITRLNIEIDNAQKKGTIFSRRRFLILGIFLQDSFRIKPFLKDNYIVLNAFNDALLLLNNVNQTYGTHSTNTFLAKHADSNSLNEKKVEILFNSQLDPAMEAFAICAEFEPEDEVH